MAIFLKNDVILAMISLGVLILYLGLFGELNHKMPKSKCLHRKKVLRRHLS